MQFDAFICHASEDKDAVARPLAEALADRHFSVWYDEFSLDVGDSLREAIDRGLAQSKFAVVVVSPSFFQKRWTQRELNGLVAREIDEGRKLILPVWHDIQLSEIVRHSPPLADVRAIRSVEGIEKVADQIARRIRPNVSPFVVARDILASFDWQLPPFTDEWWIDIVELRESLWSSYDRRPFMFPLPDEGPPELLRGTQLAWAVLMNDWSLDAEELCICQVTPPDQVHEFISSRPALREVAERNPDQLATYVPQLLIPDFSGEFGGIFDELVAHPNERFWKPRERELGCLRRHAFRFPDLGGHSPVDVADKWREGIGGSSYSGRALDDAAYLFWLLSDASSWMPASIRDVLVTGFRESGWWYHDIGRDLDFHAPLTQVVMVGASGNTRWSKAAEKQLASVVTQKLAPLRIKLSAKKIAAAFIEGKFIERFAEIEDERVARRNRGVPPGGE